jgi:hypothetical protein
MTEEITKPGIAGASDATLSGKILELEQKVSGRADADVKMILGGILRAGEKTLAEMDALKTRLEAAEQATRDVTEAAVKKVKRANLLAAARAAGAVDATEALQFVKLGDVTVNDAGETNAAELVAGLKAAKPHLFSKTSTSAAAASPATADPMKKSVLAMTKEEYAAAKAAIIKR